MRLIGEFILLACVISLVNSKTISRESDITNDRISTSRGTRLSRRGDEFDVEAGGPLASHKRLGAADSSVVATVTKRRHIHRDRGQPRRIDEVEELKKRRRKVKNRKKDQAKHEQELGWHYCSDGKKPKEVKYINVTEHHGMSYMCGDMYPSATCCYDHDLNMELIGDKILEEIPEHECARMLMKLRCAHCSPRSWWLFHAPDMIRLPHKRVLPIMCPSFCRKFHRMCRDSVAGLEGNDFCDYHTTNEEGPCFPDSIIRRGSID